jgi:hypothetical protein
MNVYQPAPVKTKGFAVTSLTVGIVGLVFTWVPGLNLTLGVIATVFGALGFRNAHLGRTDGKGMAIAGLVMGAITIVIAITLLVIAGVAIGSGNS